MTKSGESVPTSATREHIIPRVFGGPTEWWNLAAACNECNGLRAHMDAQAFFWLRQKLSTEEIRIVRVRVILRENRKYRSIVQKNIDIAIMFSRGWMLEHNLLQA